MCCSFLRSAQTRRVKVPFSVVNGLGDSSNTTCVKSHEFFDHRTCSRGFSHRAEEFRDARLVELWGSSTAQPLLGPSEEAAMPGQSSAPDVSIADWLQIIRAEYSEIPGLNLTRPQVECLWGLDRATTEAVLKVLVGTGFLRCTSAGGYVRADSGT